MYLHQLPAARKSVPELLTDPIALVRDVRTVVEQHRHDKQHQAITGVPVLKGLFILLTLLLFLSSCPWLYGQREQCTIAIDRFFVVLYFVSRVVTYL